ncbi:uncharacterized protein LOC112457234, partial [Temnothorax curvispinosus]|uniref:Uncharacterized protein LOC112457234 n=1 Tax=Temnothorax curvispinosus TaxID=300111 RepID=A0A6J1Q2Q0_9HYME
RQTPCRGKVPGSFTTQLTGQHRDQGAAFFNSDSDSDSCTWGHDEGSVPDLQGGYFPPVKATPHRPANPSTTHLTPTGALCGDALTGLVYKNVKTPLQARPQRI